MKFIDLSTWDRAQHYAAFRNCIQPMYCVTVNIDVTNFLNYVKKMGYSFTLAFIYAVAKCADKIENFRYRIIEGKPAIMDKIDTSFTYIKDGEELFKVVRVPMCEDMGRYVEAAKEESERQEQYFTSPTMSGDIYQFSALPWVSYTHISHTFSGNKDNAAPIFAWGKYYESNGRILMPFSAQVHHSFVDGIHIARLIDGVQSYINELQ